MDGQDPVWCDLDEWLLAVVSGVSATIAAAVYLALT